MLHVAGTTKEDHLPKTLTLALEALEEQITESIGNVDQTHRVFGPIYANEPSLKRDYLRALLRKMEANHLTPLTSGEEEKTNVEQLDALKPMLETMSLRTMGTALLAEVISFNLYGYFGILRPDANSGDDQKQSRIQMYNMISTSWLDRAKPLTIKDFDEPQKPHLSLTEQALALIAASEPQKRTERDLKTIVLRFEPSHKDKGKECVDILVAYLGAPPSPLDGYDVPTFEPELTHMTENTIVLVFSVPKKIPMDAYHALRCIDMAMLEKQTTLAAFGVRMQTGSNSSAKKYRY